MTNTPALVATWSGWYRPRRGIPWTRLAQGDSYDDAWARLLDATQSTRGGEMLVVRWAVDPQRHAASPAREAPARPL